MTVGWTIIGWLRPRYKYAHLMTLIHLTIANMLWRTIISCCAM